MPGQVRGTGHRAQVPPGRRDEHRLGELLDRARATPPHLVASFLVEEVRRLGGGQVALLLPDYEQELLVPMRGDGLVGGRPVPIRDSPEGDAFLRRTVTEHRQPGGGVRVVLPLLSNGEEIGVLALVPDRVDEDAHRWLRRLCALAVDMLIAADGYTDRFVRVRRQERMSLAAEIQRSLLPPLVMTVPQVSVAAVLEPAYDIAGDSFDYALNGETLHLAVLDAMGHGLNAAVLATVAVGAYRHARRADVGLAELYGFMDTAIDAQFGPDHFVTAQMMRLDVTTGNLEWVNAGHPAPLLLRDHRVVEVLETPGTLPVGFGGATPEIGSRRLLRGDRIVCYTDGLVEEHRKGGLQFGEDRLIDTVEHVDSTGRSVRQTARSLSHALLALRGGLTTDDASLLLVEWRGETARTTA